MRRIFERYARGSTSDPEKKVITRPQFLKLIIRLSTYVKEICDIELEVCQSVFLFFGSSDVLTFEDFIHWYSLTDRFYFLAETSLLLCKAMRIFRGCRSRGEMLRILQDNSLRNDPGHHCSWDVDNLGDDIDFRRLCESLDWF
jgi:hypothetical protein